ncbi:MAG TPA: exosortase A [Candidatus Acidoferrales bacterium]|nr:exosortase A [Candidatus Acidoferrales bacterium]
MSRGGRSVILVAALAVVPLMVYWDTVVGMAGLWSTESYRHGYLIPVISLLLLWRDRSRYSSLSIHGSWLGAGLLGALVLLWLVADATSVQQVEQLSVVLMVSAFVLTVVGLEGYHRVWFPLAFLLFAVPIGGSLIPQLMDATATIAVSALQMFDVPALREGMTISLPGGTFEIVEACSGFNYLNAGVALGVLVSHLMFRQLWKQMSYVIAVVGVFILVNGLRAFIVMFVGSTSHMQVFVGKDHVFFGWALFLSAMALMYWVAEKYSDRREEQPGVG